MSDPNAPNDPIGDDAVDPVDLAYAEAECVLRDDAARAARRARVLAAVAASKGASEPQGEPASPPPIPSVPRKTVRQPAPWLMAAGVAGVAALVGLRIAPTAVERPAKIAPAPAPTQAGQPTAAEIGPAGSVTAPPTAAAKAPAVIADASPPPAPTQTRLRAAAPLDAPPPLPIPPVQRRDEAMTLPTPLPLPPVASRAEAPPPPPPPSPPPPLPIPPVARRVEAPAPAAAMAIGPAYGEVQRSLLIPNPVWVRRPSREDIAQYYPERAQRTETNGSATISCTVRANGTLADCAVVAEAPGDYGFGEAALRMARIFRVNPTTADGTPTEGRTVRERIEFKVPN